MENIVIALTGAMGCGKSAAAEAFAELGATVLDTDKLSHTVIESDPCAVAEIKKIFGAPAYLPDGKPDRAKIAEAAFANKDKLAALENVVHPAVERLWTKASLEKNPDGSSKVVVVEVPLLFEKKLEKKFKICVSVLCSEPLRLKRLTLRGMSPNEIKERDAFQMKSAEKAKLADVVLFNESGREFLKRQAEVVLSRLKHD